MTLSEPYTQPRPTGTGSGVIRYIADRADALATDGAALDLKAMRYALSPAWPFSLATLSDAQHNSKRPTAHEQTDQPYPF